MDNFGKKLLEARQSRGLELDQVARETNISARYLQALENEDFTVLPAEPYLLGFLRNYCEYLGLNSAEFVTAYKNIKIQEAPVPLKELMPKRGLSQSIMGNRPVARKALILIPLFLILIGIGIVLGYLLLKPRTTTENPLEQTIRNPEQYTLDVNKQNLKGRFYTDDSIIVTTDTNSYPILIEATAPAVNIKTNEGSWFVELGQDMTIHLAEEDSLALSIFVSDLFKNDPSKGAEIHFALSPKQIDSGFDSIFENGVDIALSQDNSKPVDVTKHQVLFEGGSAYPVTLNATFRGYCLFRYESDRTIREERYFQKSELLTVQAKNGLRIWASNGNAVKFQIVAAGKTVDLELSRPGEVIVQDMKWIIDEDTGRYKFVVMDID